MQELSRKSLAAVGRDLVVVGLALFLPAGRIDYWQAWIYLSVLATGLLGITFYLINYDQALLARRIYFRALIKSNEGRPEKSQNVQRVIEIVIGCLYFVMLIVTSLDQRFASNRFSEISMPVAIVVAGDLLVGLGLLVVFFSFRSNSFASVHIEAIPDQTIVSTGAYGWVRHPMYTGLLLVLLGTPLALGSFHALPLFIPLAFAFVLRLWDEEAFMLRYFSSYEAYKQKVRARLLPFIW